MSKNKSSHALREMKFIEFKLLIIKGWNDKNKTESLRFLTKVRSGWTGQDCNKQHQSLLNSLQRVPCSLGRGRQIEEIGFCRIFIQTLTHSSNFISSQHNPVFQFKLYLQLDFSNAWELELNNISCMQDKIKGIENVCKRGLGLNWKWQQRKEFNYPLPWFSNPWKL
jgi:hypothetical protein